MSLIRVRRERKKQWIDVKKTFSTRKLGIFLTLVLLGIWYLTTRF
jgi:hypothetical protein